MKLNVFSTVSIFHQRKNIRTVINIAPILFVFLGPILDKTHKILYWFYVIYASSSFVLNKFPFISDVTFSNFLILIKFAGLIVISFFKTFSFLKWQSLRFMEDINRLDEEVWVKAIDS